MKTIQSLKIIMCISVLFSINTLINSQSKQILSASVNSGLFIPLDLLTERMNNGFSAGIDLESRNLNFGVYFSAKYNLSKYKNTPENLNKNMTSAIFEMNIGPRWYLGKLNNFQLNLDLGFAAFAGNFINKLKFGFSSAAGINFPIKNKLILNAGSRFCLIGIDYFQPYVTVYGGLRYNFN